MTYSSCPGLQQRAVSGPPGWHASLLPSYYRLVLRTWRRRHTFHVSPSVFCLKKFRLKCIFCIFPFIFFSGHPLSPPSFSCHSIPFSISLQFSFPSSPSASFSLLLLHLHPPFLLPCMCKRRVEGVRDGGKAFACRKFFSPSVLTCSPAGQHILSTSVGLAGQAEPYLLSPPFLLAPSLLVHTLIWAAGVGWWRRRRWGGSWVDIFSWITLSSGFPLPVFFRCSFSPFCERVIRRKRF